MYSERVMLFGVSLGTVWFPMLFVILAVLIGLLLKRLLRNVSKGD
jgi:hypothetical protein